jgi:multiple sugar transport system permease protein
MQLGMGKASAMAWILFIVIIVFTVLLFKTSARWVYYGGGEK